MASVPEDVGIQCFGHVCWSPGCPLVLPAGSGECTINSYYFIGHICGVSGCSPDSFVLTLRVSSSDLDLT